jgi:hypothetical protein
MENLWEKRGESRRIEDVTFNVCHGVKHLNRAQYATIVRILIHLFLDDHHHFFVLGKENARMSLDHMENTSSNVGRHHIVCAKT